jgi:hypothetical protein
MDNAAGPDTPPFDVVATVVAALRAHGAEAAIGGSGLLAALGLVEQVRDWDVTTDTDTGVVERALRSTGLPYRRSTAGDGPYRSRARVIVAADEHDVDVLVAFAVQDGDRVVPLPTRVTRTWRGLPIADPLVWRDAYRLLGRTERAVLLQNWIDEDH